MSDPKVVELTKLEAARRQINAAVRMYFGNEDPVAIHALAAAGAQIVTDLGAKKNMKLGMESGIHYIRPERQKEFRQMMREPQNHIKHADREGDEDKILEYRPATIEFHIMFGATGYREYTGIDTPETRVFMIWLLANNPDLISEDEFKNFVAKYNADFGGLHDEDKSLMLELIDRLRREQPFEGIDYRK